MTLKRFEQIKRYLHLSEPFETLPRRSWYQKLLPLADRLRKSFQAYMVPASDVSIDEMMVRFAGRSFHTLQVPGKPIPLGYKILALSERGYTYDFLFTSRVESFSGLENPENYDKPIRLSPTSRAVLKMCLTLPYEVYSFTLFCDNYFSNIPLFQVLREYGIGACGTARPNSAEFPAPLKIDKKKSNLPWGFLAGQKVRDVLAILWQDNNLVRLLTTAHVGGDFDQKTRNRRRPRETPRNRETIRRIWGQNARKEIPVPALTADYNDKMGGVDIADQLRAYLTTQLRVARNWMPLFFWLIDTTLINCFILARENHPSAKVYNKSNRWRWHEDLAWDLVHEGYKELNPPANTTGYSQPTSKPGRQPLGNTSRSRQNGYISKHYRLPVCRKQGNNHVMERLQLRRLCVFCRFLRSSHISPDVRCQILQHPQAPQHYKIRRSFFQCQSCKLPLCKDFCFRAFHEI